MQKGIFVVIDGIDGSGKATQTTLLRERLAADGIPCEKIDFPSYDKSFFGTLVGECLAGKHGDFLHLDPKIASTLYALDRFEASPKIRAWLQEGKVVVADRFSSSNQIHQGGKIVDVEKRDAFLAWIEEMEHEVLGVPRPDAVIYLKVPVEVSQALLAKQRDTKNAALDGEQKDTVEKDRMYLERSAESAARLAGTHDTWRTVECADTAGAMRTPEEIHEEVYALVKGLV
jgi:dTMP kinase